MAAADGRADRSVAERLFDPEEAGGWEFWQAVRLLEAMQGTWTPVPRRAVRFSSEVGLAFPTSDIASIRLPAPRDEGAEGAPPRMSVHFMGLAGVNGPLPRPFTELVMERASRITPALPEFLDIFNDRLVRMVYQVRKKHRIALSLAPPERTEVARSLFPLAGLGTNGLRRRSEVAGVPDAGILAYTGLLAHQPRSMAGLEGLLTSYFGVQVRGRQLIGRWLTIEPDQHTTLGVTGRNQRLGSEATLGTRFWDQSAAFELRLGPLTRAQYLGFLPNGAAHRPLRELTRFYAGTERDFTARLVLEGTEVPSASLGGQTRLGWTSWLGSYRKPEAEVVVRMADTFRFLALGDSYTIGEGVAEEERWPVRLVGMLAERGVAVGPPEIIARTGWTTDELDAAIDGAAPNGPYALVSLLVGVNNQYRGRPADEYRTQFAALLARAVAFAGDVAERVIVLSIPDWGVTPSADRDRAVIAAEIDHFNDIAREETSLAGARFVDVTAASRAAGAHPRMLAADQLHPSGAAYEEWARLAVPQAMEALTPGG